MFFGLYYLNILAALFGLIRKLKMPKYVKDCLANKSNVLIAVKSSSFLVEALELMRSHRIRAILVTDGDRLEGILSQGDCAIKALLPDLKAKEVLVKNIMTSNPLTVGLEDDLRDCMKIMIDKRIRHLPVVESDKVVGIVSVGDVAKVSLEHRAKQFEFLKRYSEVWANPKEKH